jgi:hypothetical protein
MKNPFDLEHFDPWSEDFIDVESLTARVSDEITRCIEQARRSGIDGHKIATEILLVKGPAGSGKTHLFGRLRRQSGSRATFVLWRPEIGVDPTPRLLLSNLVEALRRPASGTADRQLDVVVGSTLGWLQGKPGWPHTMLEEYRAQSAERRAEAFEQIVAAAEEQHPDISTKYLEVLLTAPFLETSDRRAAVTWLSGEEPTEAQLRRLGMREALGDGEVMPALRTLALVAGLGAPLVLVFDQLENLYDADDRPDRINSFGNLAAELFDHVDGLVVVQMSVDSEWNRRISPALSHPQKSRLERRQLLLDLPTASEREALVRAWVSRLPELDREPFPFRPEQIEAWRQAPGLTPRMLMIACRRQLLGEDPSEPLVDAAEPGEEISERLAQLWDEQLQQARADVSRCHDEHRGVAAERLAGGLVCAANLSGLDPRVDRAPVRPSVRLRQQGREVLVGILQAQHAGSISRSLQKATATAGSADLILLREFALAVPGTWRVVEQRRREFLAAARAGWVDLQSEEVARLLALHDFVSHARSGDHAATDGTPIPERKVLDWLGDTLEFDQWPALRQVLARIAGEARADVPEPAAPPPVERPEAACSEALAVLERLHLASVDRIVRELRAVDRTADRRLVVDQLLEARGAVRWIGSHLVALAEPRP